MKILVFSGLVSVFCQLEVDDECAASGCALNALQLHARLESRSDAPVLGKPKTSIYVRPENHLDIHPSQFPISNKCAHPPCSGQIHLQLGGPGEMVVSFASQPESETESKVKFGQGSLDQEATGKAETYSQLMFWREMLWNPRMQGGYGLDQSVIAKDMSTNTWAYNERTGWKYPSWREVGTQQVEGNRLGWYKNPLERYDSPKIHTVRLTGLISGQKYSYQVENDDRNFEFTMPLEEKYPFSVGLVGDIGQTPVSNSSMHLLRGLKPDVVLITGDLAYADGYYPRWDSFGIMLETLASRIPVMSCVGNHEYGSAEAFKSYNARFPMPHEQSGSTDNTYWSRDIGPMHVVALNSYASSKPGSYQYRWLEKDLKRFSREKTPWLVALMHAPWYNSNIGHYEEGKPMRMNLEELFFNHSVDLVLAGHVHSFERTWPTYKNETHPCGPVYINIGDGGNREGPYAYWLPFEKNSSVWSAFRQGSFGIGDLKIINSSHAFFNWKRNACFDDGKVNFDASNCTTQGDDSGTSLVTDDMSWIIRDTARCRKA